MNYSELELSQLLKIIMYHKYSSKYSKININPVYKELINRYFKETNNLLDLNDKNKEILYSWTKDKVGYELLNELIKNAIDTLTGNYKNKHSYFVLDNLTAISDIVTLQINDSFMDTNKEMTPVSAIDKEDTEKMFIEILKEIDPSLDWLNMYNEAKSQNRIIYLDELNEEEKKEIAKKLQMDSFEGKPDGCTYIDGEQYIWLTRTNTLEDVISIVHEFMHYVVNNKNDVKNRPHILLEFPSIFYELYIHNFLLKKGFGIGEINLLKAKRMNNSLYGASGMADVFEIISMYILNGKVDREMLVEKKKKSTKNTKGILLNDTINIMLKHDKDLLNSDAFAESEYEDCIKKIITRTDAIYVWYPYIIGTYFSNRILEKMDEYTLLKMKYITENMAGLNVRDAFELLGIDVASLGIVSEIPEKALI